MEKNIIHISVVCPTYNSSAFIMRTLESVVAQTRTPDEIIIVDDGSDDDTVAKLELFKQAHPSRAIHIIVGPHAGPGAARNQGIRHASGEWIAFIDSDDVWRSDKLAVVEQCIQSHTTCNYFCHDEVQVTPSGNVYPLALSKRFNATHEIGPQLFMCNFFSTSAVVCTRQLIQQANFFNEELHSSQDYELWLRMVPSMKPCYIPEILGEYHLREGNISTSPLWPRFKNNVRILWWYRNLVSPGLVFSRILKLIFDFAKCSIVQNVVRR